MENIYVCTLRKLNFHFLLSNWMGYDHGDSFPSIFWTKWNSICVQNWKENGHHDHIPFTVTGNGSIVFSVHTNQAFSRLRDWRLLASWGPIDDSHEILRASWYHGTERFKGTPSIKAPFKSYDDSWFFFPIWLESIVKNVFISLARLSDENSEYIFLFNSF